MKKINLKYKTLLLLLVVATMSFKSSVNFKEITFPTPEVGNMLFYVQRTINENTIIYALNEDAEGNLNEKEPIKAYWIKYAQGGKIDPLTYIQKTFAYGVSAKVVDNEKKSFSFSFVSYHKKEFYLAKSPVDNKYHVYGYFNNKINILKNICVKIEGGTFWVPNVKYAEVKGKDPATLSEIIEIIKP
jgi:hypothetical protein